MNNAYLYLPPIILAVIAFAIIWAIRKIRRVTASNSRTSRMAEQSMLSSLGVLPAEWADEETPAASAHPESQQLPAEPVPASVAPSVQPSPSTVPWKVPAGSMMPPAAPLRPTAVATGDPVTQAAQGLADALRGAAAAVEQAAASAGTPAQRAEKIVGVASNQVASLPISAVFEAGLRPPA